MAITDPTFEKIVLMLSATPGITAPAATATKPAIKAYSMRSWACVSLQIRSFQNVFISGFILPLSVSLSDFRVSRQTSMANWGKSLAKGDKHC